MYVEWGVKAKTSDYDPIDLTETDEETQRRMMDDIAAKFQGKK